MNLHKNILYILLVSIAIAFGFNNIFSQINIQNIDINPLNRTTIYCSALPENFATRLSDDKQKVVIMLKDATVPDSLREKHSTGIISDVYVQSFKNNLGISIILKEKRGYTAVPLVYSRAIMAEVFKWDQLTPAEDEYRTGLLALEANIRNSAEKSFEKAVSLGNADASVFLGILRLEQGRIKSALENLLIAYKFQVKIPDCFAALSQIMKMSNFQRESGILADSFYKQTGLRSFPEIVVPENTELTENDLHYDSLLKEISFLITKDSTLLQQKKDSIRKDSADNKRFKEIFDNKNKEISKKDAITQILESFIPAGFSKLLFVFIVLFLVIFTVLLFAYFKWRKKQVESRKKKPSVQKRSGDQQKQSTAIARKAVDAYQKSGTIVDKNSGTDTDIPRIVKTEEKKAGDFKQSFDEKLNELAGRLDEPKREILLAEMDRKTIGNQSDEVKLTPKLELALHLLEEQKNLKNKETGNIAEADILTDLSKLKEVAKSLGITKESRQPGKKEIENDKQTISQLADKFAREIEKKD
ncbi:MAG: hypothetical protein EPN82_10465 [Bacteroidetes bacterium]|nr:MAG: hypothetical protein EPN82_10465 [Bacteroidota bacterium]